MTRGVPEFSRWVIRMQMQMQILKRLCHAQLPMAIYGEEDVGKCSVLQSAGLIEAQMTQPAMVWRRPIFWAQGRYFVSPLGAGRRRERRFRPQAAQISLRSQGSFAGSNHAPVARMSSFKVRPAFHQI